MFALFQQHLHQVEEQEKIDKENQQEDSPAKKKKHTRAAEGTYIPMSHPAVTFEEALSQAGTAPPHHNKVHQQLPAPSSVPVVKGHRFSPTRSCVSSEQLVDAQRRRSPSRRRTSSPSRSLSTSSSQTLSERSTSVASTPTRKKKAHTISTDVPPVPTPLVAAPSPQEYLPQPLEHPVLTGRRLPIKSTAWKHNKIQALIAGQRQRAKYHSTFAATLKHEIWECDRLRARLQERNTLEHEDGDGMPPGNLGKQRATWQRQLMDFFENGMVKIQYEGSRQGKVGRAHLSPPPQREMDPTPTTSVTPNNQIKRLKKGDGLRRFGAASGSPVVSQGAPHPSSKPTCTANTPKMKTGLSPHGASEAFDAEYKPPQPVAEVATKKKQPPRAKKSPSPTTSKRSLTKSEVIESVPTNQPQDELSAEPTRLSTSPLHQQRQPTADPFRPFSSADAADTAEFISSFLRRRLANVSSTAEERQTLCRRFFAGHSSQSSDALVSVPRLPADSHFFKWENARIRGRGSNSSSSMVYDSSQHHLTMQLVNQEMFSIQSKILSGAR